MYLFNKDSKVDKIEEKGDLFCSNNQEFIEKIQKDGGESLTTDEKKQFEGLSKETGLTKVPALEYFEVLRSNQIMQYAGGMNHETYLSERNSDTIYQNKKGHIMDILSISFLHLSIAVIRIPFMMVI